MAGKYRNQNDSDDPMVPLSVRVPLSLWKKLKEDADINKRALNGEILFLCERALKERDAATN